MARERKTTDERDVEGDYGQGFELVTGTTSREDAIAQLRTYRENEPGVRFRIRKYRVPKATVPA